MEITTYYRQPIGSLQALNRMINDALVFLRAFVPEDGSALRIQWRDMDEDEHSYTLIADSNGGFDHDNGFCSYDQDDRLSCTMEIVNLFGLAKRDDDLKS